MKQRVGVGGGGPSRGSGDKLTIRLQVDNKGGWGGGGVGHGGGRGGMVRPPQAAEILRFFAKRRWIFTVKKSKDGSRSQKFSACGGLF